MLGMEIEETKELLVDIIICVVARTLNARTTSKMFHLTLLLIPKPNLVRTVHRTLHTQALVTTQPLAWDCVIISTVND